MRRNHDRAAQRVFDRVGQQVEHDRFPHVRIDVGQGLMTVDDQVKPGPRAQFGERRGDFRGQRADIGAHQAGGGAARFDTGELQQRVDQAQQPPRVTPGSTQPIPRNRLRTHVGERIFQRSEQQR